MSTLASLAEVLTDTAGTATLGRRVVDSAMPYEFRLHMRNDFLTSQGAAFKWQEVEADVTRTVIGAVEPPLVPVRYTWQDVRSRTGTASTAGPIQPWNFARGQGFTSALMHSEAHGTPPSANYPPPTTPDIRYPDLPKTPTVDLLLMLSWDVLMFETMCTELTITPALGRTGVTADLERLSGAWADLRFSNPETNAVFRNSKLSAVKNGYGMAAGRPVASYAYQCLDCSLTSRLGPLVQQGTSTYWGTLQVDLHTGDLVGADFIEMILATVTRPGGRTMPVQKRRIVRIEVIAPASEQGEPAAPAALGRADPAVLERTAAGAARMAGYLRTHIASFSNLPAGFEPLTNVGFRSIVGMDLHALLRRVQELRTGLHDWAAGDLEAAERIRAGLPTMRAELEAFQAYCLIAADVAGQLNFLTGSALEKVHRDMAAVRQDVAQLAKDLARLEDGDDDWLD